MKRKSILWVVLITFIINMVLPYGAQANVLPYMPAAGTMITTTANYELPCLVGMKFTSDNPFEFTFILSGGNIDRNEQAIKAELAKIHKYFLAALTIPEQDLWVNLSPYEQDRIAPDILSQTELGKDLLGEDYVLKQLAASLTYPESDTGKKYWQSINGVGTNNHSPATNNFNKVWIVPGKIKILEAKDRLAIDQATLKVMTDQDYLAMQQNNQGVINRGTTPNVDAFKQYILPSIEQEVNQGQHFSQFRQIYSALIMAGWFKNKLKNTILNESYLNKSKIKGVDTQDKAIREKIYAEYVKAFQAGAYNIIKSEHVTPVKISRRAYFSGGVPADLAVKAGEAPTTLASGGEVDASAGTHGRLIEEGVVEEPVASDGVVIAPVSVHDSETSEYPGSIDAALLAYANNAGHQRLSPSEPTPPAGTQSAEQGGLDMNGLSIEAAAMLRKIDREVGEIAPQFAKVAQERNLSMPARTMILAHALSAKSGLPLGGDVPNRIEIVSGMSYGSLSLYRLATWIEVYLNNVPVAYVNAEDPQKVIVGNFETMRKQIGFMTAEEVLRNERMISGDAAIYAGLGGKEDYRSLLGKFRLGNGLTVLLGKFEKVYTFSLASSYQRDRLRRQGQIAGFGDRERDLINDAIGKILVNIPLGDDYARMITYSLFNEVMGRDPKGGIDGEEFKRVLAAHFLHPELTLDGMAGPGIIFSREHRKLYGVSYADLVTQEDRDRTEMIVQKKISMAMTGRTDRYGALTPKQLEIGKKLALHGVIGQAQPEGAVPYRRSVGSAAGKIAAAIDATVAEIMLDFPPMTVLTNTSRSDLKRALGEFLSSVLNSTKSMVRDSEVYKRTLEDNIQGWYDHFGSAPCDCLRGKLDRALESLYQKLDAAGVRVYNDPIPDDSGARDGSPIVPSGLGEVGSRSIERIATLRPDQREAASLRIVARQSAMSAADVFLRHHSPSTELSFVETQKLIEAITDLLIYEHRSFSMAESSFASENSFHKITANLKSSRVVRINNMLKTIAGQGYGRNSLYNVILNATQAFDANAQSMIIFGLPDGQPAYSRAELLAGFTWFKYKMYSDDALCMNAIATLFNGNDQDVETALVRMAKHMPDDKEKVLALAHQKAFHIMNERLSNLSGRHMRRASEPYQAFDELRDGYEFTLNDFVKILEKAFEEAYVQYRLEQALGSEPSPREFARVWKKHLKNKAKGGRLIAPPDHDGNFAPGKSTLSRADVMKGIEELTCGRQLTAKERGQFIKKWHIVDERGYLRQLEKVKQQYLRKHPDAITFRYEKSKLIFKKGAVGSSVIPDKVSDGERPASAKVSPIKFSLDEAKVSLLEEISTSAFATRYLNEEQEQSLADALVGFVQKHPSYSSEDVSGFIKSWAQHIDGIDLQATFSPRGWSASDRIDALASTLVVTSLWKVVSAVQNGGFAMQNVGKKQEVDTTQGEVEFSRQKALTQWKNILGVELITVSLKF